MIRTKSVAALLCALMCLALSFSFFACKSTPKEEPPVEEPPVEEPVEEPTPEPEPEPEPAADFSDKNNALMEQVENARKNALAAGAKDAHEGAWKIAEAEYAAQKAALAANPGADMTKALEDLNKRYEALTAYANAKAKKDRIDSLGYASYNQGAYDEGKNLLDELAASMSDPAAELKDAAQNPLGTALKAAQGNADLPTGSAWLKKASSAEEAFDKVLDAAFRSLAKAERAEAFKAKQNADSVKAAVSKKDEYNKGVESFKQGDSQYVTGNPEGSLSSYTSAKNVFTRLFTEISDARAKAQAAIEAAKKRVSASEEVAIEADNRAPLEDGSIEGIEDEDAQLLDEDDFSETESQANALEESVEASVDGEDTEDSEAAEVGEAE